MNSDDPRHGTANGYSNQKCRCQECRAAWAAYIRARRALVAVTSTTRAYNGVTTESGAAGECANTPGRVTESF